MCGQCLEISCDPAWIQDNYGQKLDRTWSCYNNQESVVVRVTDTCPCTYPREFATDGAAVSLLSLQSRARVCTCSSPLARLWLNPQCKKHPAQPTSTATNAGAATIRWAAACTRAALHSAACVHSHQACKSSWLPPARFGPDKHSPAAAHNAPLANQTEPLRCFRLGMGEARRQEVGRDWCVSRVSAHLPGGGAPATHALTTPTRPARRPARRREVAPCAMHLQARPPSADPFMAECQPAGAPG
jgi:hypothetical protein